MHYVDEVEYISSKVLQLIPKTILFNKSQHKIKLLNQSQLRDSVLEPNEKQPLYVYDKVDKQKTK